MVNEAHIQDSIYLSKIFHPQQNLKQQNSPETDFCLKFAQYYKGSFIKIHRNTIMRESLFLREFPVSESGIADLVVLSWNSRVNKEDPFQVRAFEIKINDWKAGLAQAYRYNAYSNATILVLPLRKITPAIDALAYFQTLNVGLWGFDENKMILQQYYTPRPKKPKIQKKRYQMINSISKLYDFKKDSNLSSASLKTVK